MPSRNNAALQRGTSSASRASQLEMAGSTSSNLTVVPVVVDVAGWYSDASGKGGSARALRPGQPQPCPRRYPGIRGNVGDRQRDIHRDHHPRLHDGLPDRPAEVDVAGWSRTELTIPLRRTSRPNCPREILRLRTGRTTDRQPGHVGRSHRSARRHLHLFLSDPPGDARRVPDRRRDHRCRRRLRVRVASARASKSASDSGVRSATADR